MKVGIHSFTVVVIMAIIGIVMVKTILNKWYVPGATEVVNMV